MNRTVLPFLECLIITLLVPHCQSRNIINSTYGTARPAKTTLDYARYHNYNYRYNFTEPPMFKFLKRGFRIWFEDHEIIRFYLYANMNEPFNEKHPESTEPQLFAVQTDANGPFWIYKNQFLEFAPNDTLYYFLKVLVLDGSYSVSKVFSTLKPKQ